MKTFYEFVGFMNTNGKGNFNNSHEEISHGRDVVDQGGRKLEGGLP